MSPSLPNVKGSAKVVAKSHARFLAIHICRCCKQEFYPTAPRKIFLCEPCEAIPLKERRQIINARSLLKREGRNIKHRDGSTTDPTLNSIAEGKMICDSPLTSIDRASVNGALKYWKHRPWHFTDVWKLPATDENIRLAVRGYSG